MKKILSEEFQNELVENLIEAGISECEAKSICNKRYKEELKKGALEILNKMINFIKEDKIKEAKDMLAFSPAGDGYGFDNYLIDFSSLFPEHDERFSSIDISDVLRKLKDNEE